MPQQDSKEMSDAISSIQLEWSLWFAARLVGGSAARTACHRHEDPRGRLLKDVVKGLGFMWLLEASKE